MAAKRRGDGFAGYNIIAAVLWAVWAIVITPDSAMRLKSA